MEMEAENTSPRTPTPKTVHRSAPPRPRWVNVAAAITIALVAVVVTVHLAGGGMGMHH